MVIHHLLGDLENQPLIRVAKGQRVGWARPLGTSPVDKDTPTGLGKELQEKGPLGLLTRFVSAAFPTFQRAVRDIPPQLGNCGIWAPGSHRVQDCYEEGSVKLVW